MLRRERVPNHQSLIETPALLSMKYDGDTVYVGQACTNEASDHRLTLRRRFESASSTDLEGLEAAVN